MSSLYSAHGAASYAASLGATRRLPLQVWWLGKEGHHTWAKFTALSFLLHRSNWLILYQLTWLGGGICRQVEQVRDSSSLSPALHDHVSKALLLGTCV